MQRIPTRNFQALVLALTFYVIISPISSYNTLAMFGLVESRFVVPQLIATAIMIFFAIIASKPIGHHCRTNEEISTRNRIFWQVGFYVIGPPILFAYYRWKMPSK